jgi:hypothetical protein
LVAALPTIVFFRHPLLPFPPNLFARPTLRSIDLRLLASLFFQRTAGQALLHALQRHIVIVQPWFFLRWWRFSFG